MYPDRTEPPQAAASQPTPAARPAAQRRKRARAAATALILLAGCLATVAVTTVARAPAARADTVPPAPSGWTTVFGDNFAGAANSAPSASNWFYDIGTGYGTGEHEQTTNSTSNVYLDGNGHLVLKAINNNGTWTSGRIESTRDDFQAPPGGKLEMTASIEQPNPANGLGYWPAFWALGSPMRTGGGWPTSGEIDMMEDVNGLNEASQTLHDAANSPGHALIAVPGRRLVLPDRLPHLLGDHRPHQHQRGDPAVPDGRHGGKHDHRSLGRHDRLAGGHRPRILHHLRPGHGRELPGRRSATAPPRPRPPSSGASMSVGYVAVYEQGGNSTPTGTASATGQLTGLNGQCLANQNSLNTASNPIVLSGCNGSAGQQWSPYTDGTLRTQGGCLDVVSAGTTSGTDVDWYPCNGTAAQGWTHQSNGELVNPSSGLCLTDPGGNTSARLDIETCTDTSDQQWTLPTGGGTGTGNTVTVTGPGNQSSTVGTAASLQIKASDSGSGQTLSYSATGLPAGLSINSSTGLISGTPTAAGTSNVTVTARDGTGATGSTSFTWTVSAGGTGGSCGTTNLALNKTATSSSTESAADPASAAVDGNTGTRWSSAFSDPQWLEVDLGSSQSICQVAWTGRPPTRPRSRSRPPPTAPTGRPSTPPPAAPAAPRPSTSPGPAATSACTAPPGPPSTATACGSSACTAPSVAAGAGPAARPTPR